MVLSFFWIAIAFADELDQFKRTQQIQDRLESFQSENLQGTLDTVEYLQVMARNECRSSFEPLKIMCLIDFAKKNCKGKAGKKNKENCEGFSDVALVNKLSENHFVGAKERYQLMNTMSSSSSEGGVYRKSLVKRLQVHYAQMATEFLLSQDRPCLDKDFNCLASAMDRYCVQMADTKNLSWQHCVSALVWFVRTQRD